MDLLVVSSFKRQVSGFQAQTQVGTDVIYTKELILFDRVWSFSSYSQGTCTARSVGTRVNKDTTSKDTTIWIPLRHCGLMNCAQSWEFLTWLADRPTAGFSKDARNFDSPCVGDDRNKTVGLSGVSGLCTVS